MKQFYSIAELASANLPDLPRTEKSLDNLARSSWRADPNTARRVPGKTKPVWEYHFSLLPSAAQMRLLIIHSAPANDDRDLKAERRQVLWDRYEKLSAEHKATCEQRLKALQMAAELEDAGMSAKAAVTMACRKAGIAKSALYEWRGMVEGVDRQDWVAALAPSYQPDRSRSECHPKAWEYITSDFLRPEAPKFSACYRRLLVAANKEKWNPVPHERSLRRRLDAEVPEAVQKLARKGKETAKGLYPAQRRTRSHLHAMQMVNMDGHKLDVFVRVPWSEQPVRLFLLGIQDLYSGKVLAWRISDSENKETVRLVIGDMVEQFGIPERIYLDNGRSFASKWISGGAATRYRFKVRDEDPEGLLVTLGIEPRWTNPYSGQSKPIERAWGDLAENISKHPFCAGAYTGNKPDAKPENYGNRAVPIDEFREHIGREIAEHNARIGRKAQTCNGRSFDQTFEESIAHPGTIVRWPSKAQRSLWLLASEIIRSQKGSGEIHYHGNRYWSRELNQHAGQKVTIRFDPDNLHGSIKVYDLKNVLICEAPCIADAGFDDQEAARQHARKRRDYQKAIAAEKAAHTALTAGQLADILKKGEPSTAPAPTPVRSKVTRLATGNLAVQMPAPSDEHAFEDSFSRALSRVADERAVLEFPRGDRSAK
ncbi:transposase domain-containing protein [Rhizobium sp. NFR12]|uniref:transposase domain-containing protein n=1 Tax=Rhizobium sp. NFR12 TaxID=1566261 RepID=UPI0008A7671D|nr:transposase domain-containing protein [Rhizobium sp. NFR12]SEH22569.1 Mu transposase, C-terminal [Rhizobium sp. NFR12]